ncbi:MAG: PAS domain-containing protein, partial [Candidatus Scalindua sp.]
MNYGKMTKAELISKLKVFESGIEIAEHKQAQDKLRESEKRYQSISELTSDYVYHISVSPDKQMKVDWITEDFANITGYTPDDVKTPDMWKNVVHPDDLSTVMEKNQNIMLGNTEKYECRIITKKSETIWLNVYGRPEWDTKKRKVTGIIGAVSNITERKQAEENIKLSESRYRSLFKNMLNGFAYCKILVDENNKPIDFVYLEVNDAFGTLTGLKKDSVIGRKVTEVIPGISGSEPDLFEIYGKVAMTGVETRFDIYFEPLKIWLSVSVYCPKEGYFVAIFDNITERKKTDELLKSSSDYLQKLNDSLGAVIVTVKLPERVIEYVNRAIGNVFGYKPDECIGKKTKMFYPAVEEYQDFGRSLKSAIKEGKDELRVERLYKRKNGEIFPCEVTTTFLKENEKIVRVISILQDVTERKRAEYLLKVRESQQREISKIGKFALTSETELTELMDRIVYCIAKTLDVEYCKVLELLPDGKKLLL